MQDPPDTRETTDTIAPDTDRAERHTLPPGEADAEATRAAATMLPAAPSLVPTAQELEATALAAAEPPEWFKASFIGQALTSFADDARAIREGRSTQHVELMKTLSDQRAEQTTALAKVVADMETLARELSANFELLSGEFRRHRDASNERDAEQDGRIQQLERKVAEFETKFASLLEAKVSEALRPMVEEFDEIRRLFAELKRNEPTRQTPATPAG
jgi:uncharacterized coiled-coil protein SlyX